MTTIRGRLTLWYMVALGVTILSEPDIGVQQGYMTESNYTTGYSRAPGFLGINAPATLDSRYLTEDVGYSLVFFTDLARGAWECPLPPWTRSSTSHPWSSRATARKEPARCRWASTN